MHFPPILSPQRRVVTGYQNIARKYFADKGFEHVVLLSADGECAHAAAYCCCLLLLLLPLRRAVLLCRLLVLVLLLPLWPLDTRTHASSPGLWLLPPHMYARIPFFHHISSRLLPSLVCRRAGGCPCHGLRRHHP
jgi:hypothetical protein